MPTLLIQCIDSCLDMQEMANNTFSPMAYLCTVGMMPVCMLASTRAQGTIEELSRTRFACVGGLGTSWAEER